MIVVDTLAEAIETAKTGSQCMTKCTSHDDGEASLHVSPGTSQPVIMKCHAGCETEDILREAGLDFSAILDERNDDWKNNDTRAEAGTWTPRGDASHVYSYYDEHGTLMFQTLRTPLPGGKKTFSQRRPDSTKPNGWTWNLQGVRRVLYRLPELLVAKGEGQTIFVVEGEKDVESMRAKGYAATSSPMGAGKWDESYSDSLAGANVIIIADADATGRAHARQVRESLLEHGCTVAITEPMAGSKDITDQFEAGGTIDDLVETTPEVEEKRESYGVDVLEAVKRVFQPKSYVIPNVLARGDRLLLTGFEGHGKSTLMRQLAVQVAAGIHPWNGSKFDPQKVLFIDCENHPDQVLSSWQDMIGLAARHEAPMKPGQLTILEEWDNELDLTSGEGHDWMMERIHAYQPDLVCMGPLYNMSNRDLKDDETVRKIKKVVNEARGICGTAFIMEHHAPHKSPNDTTRSVRPYGSSTFLKWPDFGYGIKPMEQEGVYEWQKTRFPRVRTRDFPTHVRWGKPNSDEWPWVPAEEMEDGTFA